MANLAALPIHVPPREPALPSLSNPFFNNGLQRGSLAEIYGRRSSGRISFVHSVLATATAAGEVCAVVDWRSSFAPGAAAAAGILLDRLVWVRCHGNVQHALRSTDLLLHAGGFGVVLLDLCEAPALVLNRIPLSYWYRFRRTVEHTPTILLVCGERPQAKSCAIHSVELASKRFHWSGDSPFAVLRGIESEGRLKAPGCPPQPISLQTVA